MKKRKNKQRGITLIALVVTIIILIILAGVSMNMIVGENGIIKRAAEATKETEIATDKEKIILAVSEAQITDDGYQKLNLNNLQEAVDNQFGEEKAKVIDNGDGTFSIVVSNNQKTYSISVNGTVEYNSNLLINNVKIGDYVNYIPELMTSSYQIENVGVDAEINYEDLNWRVLNIKDGKVILISSDSMNAEITLSGADGYNNGEYILNDICKNFYSKDNIGEARSINIYDIENLSNYDKKSFINEDGISYGDERDYTSELYRFYPNGFNANNYEYPLLGYSQAGDDGITVKQTGYEYKIDEYLDENEYDIIKSTKSYWLASKYEYCKSGYAYFGLYMIGAVSKLFYPSNVYCSRNRINNSTYSIRPIVEINSNVEVNDMDKGNNGLTMDKAWEIKAN